jgi:sterol desaturase/sphingolipid hydroxylase (fatty acid hydroxylase superfamily)
MDSNWLPHSGRLESCVFLGALLFFALIETFRPFQTPKLSTSRRWLNHGVLLALNTAINVVLFRGGTVVFAILIAAKGYGILNRFALPYAVRFAIGFVAIDLLHYASHRVYHRIPFLWRIHRVHHTDPDLDITTGFRFHPFEALLTQGLNFASIALLGPPAMAVLAVEAITLFQDVFQHANVKMPRVVDRILAAILISPSMHRIHHSTHVVDRNFGTIFPWWDRAFGTYTAQSSVELQTMETGLDGYPHHHSTSLLHTLTLPLEPDEPFTVSSTSP